MTFDEFRATLAAAAPPPDVSNPLRALWRAANGEWDAAHALAQSAPGADGAWVHAHLHRIEGDLSNAAFWYRRAGKPVCDAPLDDEWAQIAAALLDRARRPD